LHPNILFDERVAGATERVLAAGEEIMRLCVDAGGSVTGEHGIGLEKRDYMSWLFNQADLAAMSSLKRVFGSNERFNPCKAFPTAHGCGEVSHAAIARFGADAYV